MQYSIIINRKPHGHIKSSRGIRQGDPRSPFIFVIVMDFLNRLLNYLENIQATKGVMFDEHCELNHLLFADDISIFIEDNDTNLSF